ncbi:hypothetical protein ACJVC5_01300 [Peredibacter sp. HCB2-198]|uniref:hypothetical protein n=1 Tax=Peredibacter sp. HCB2-198 TaxID=3383025 RepID=UPI0038B67239
MAFRTLGLCLLFLSISVVAHANRSPAVEDFVGIEIDQPEATPHASETLFNLEQDMTKLEESRKNPPKPEIVEPSKPWSAYSMLAVVLGVGLPTFVWLTIMGHLRKKATLESASNLEVLEKYRKERELAKKNESEESVRKVS